MSDKYLQMVVYGESGRPHTIAVRYEDFGPLYNPNECISVREFWLVHSVGSQRKIKPKDYIIDKFLEAFTGSDKTLKTLIKYFGFEKNRYSNATETN